MPAMNECENCDQKKDCLSDFIPCNGAEYQLTAKDNAIINCFGRVGARIDNLCSIVGLLEGQMGGIICKIKKHEESLTNLTKRGNTMPAKSKKQRVAMAIAEHNPEQLNKKNKGLAKMSKEQLHDFAKTPAKGLPNKVKKKK